MIKGINAITKVSNPSSKCIDLSHAYDGMLGDIIKWLIIINRYCITNKMTCTILTKEPVYRLAELIIQANVVDEVIAVDHSLINYTMDKHSEFIEELIKGYGYRELTLIPKDELCTDGFISCADYVKGVFSVDNYTRTYADYIWDRYNLHGYKTVVIHVRRHWYAKCREFTTKFFIDMYNELDKYNVKCIFLVDNNWKDARLEVGAILEYPSIPIIMGNPGLPALYAIINAANYFVGCDTGIGWLALTSLAKSIILIPGNMINTSMEYKAFPGTTFITYDKALKEAGNVVGGWSESRIYSLDHKLVTDVILNEV